MHSWLGLCSVSVKWLNPSWQSIPCFSMTRSLVSVPWGRQGCTHSWSFDLGVSPLSLWEQPPQGDGNSVLSEVLQNSPSGIDPACPRRGQLVGGGVLWWLAMAAGGRGNPFWWRGLQVGTTGLPSCLNTCLETELYSNTGVSSVALTGFSNSSEFRPFLGLFPPPLNSNVWRNGLTFNL